MVGSGKNEDKRAPMYWSGDPDATGMCSGPPGMDQMQMRYPPAEDQMGDDLSLWRWFNEVIRVRRAFPAIARGRTEPVGALCDESVACFIRRSEDDEDVLVVMNLRGDTAVRDLSVVEGDLTLAAVLNTNEEGIVYEGGNLTLPAYSIAVLTFGA